MLFQIVCTKDNKFEKTKRLCISNIHFIFLFESILHTFIGDIETNVTNRER